MTKQYQNKKFVAGFGGGKFGCNFFPNARPSPDSMVSSLTGGSSVAVLGMGRIGNTSLLTETRERLRSMGKNVIWVNLDTNDTLSRVLDVILRSMQNTGNKGVIAGMKNWLEKTELIPSEIKTGIGAMISSAVESSYENFDIKYVDALF